MMKDQIKKYLGSIKPAKLAFYLFGVGSTIWFLIRVIPKPSRASYPCMKASAPFMSAFVLYLIGLASTIYLFKEEKGRLFLLKGVLGVVFVGSLLFSFQGLAPSSQFSIVDASYFKANEPIGVAQGIFPGRVVWVHDRKATDSIMANTSSDFWAQDKNCNQQLVDSMLASGIRRIGGKSNVKESWDGIFKYFNSKHDKGLVGYTPGEKFAIKINLTNSAVNPTTTDPKRMDASPQIVLAILHQLIEVVGVPQADIWIGDSYRKFRNDYYNKCHAVYPNVHYVDGVGGSGREQTKPSESQLLQFSDGQETSSIPQHYVNATYFINIPCLKSHDSAGITLAAKNHQGSVLHEGDSPAGQSAGYMHYCFPQNNTKTDQFRHLVDYIGHEELGGKTLLYIVDGLWAGRSWEGFLEKWKMAPFNNDYPSSIFMSQDAVAIESLGFDFLLTEYASKPANQKYPYMTGVDDYIKQAADPAKWPKDIQYDPENDGTLLKSQGVYEHWNNATEMKYSRNLGSGNGIELVKYSSLASDNYASEITTAISGKNVADFKIFPNPFVDHIRIDAGNEQGLNLNIYNLKGQLIFDTKMNKSYTWNGSSQNGSKVSKGIYLIRLTEINSGEIVWTEKIICNQP